MKIAIINDIHASKANRSNRLHSELVFDNLDKTISQIKKHTPDYVLILGDLVQNIDDLHDKEMLDTVLDKLQPIKDICYVASGNHEGRGFGLDYLSTTLKKKGFNDQIFGTIKEKDHALVYLSTSENKEKDTRNDFLPNDQVEWLSKTLNEIDFPTVIFSHHFLINIPHAHNFYIESSGVDNSTISNVAPVNEILLNHKEKIKASVCAHSHWLAFDNTTTVPILCLPSYSENIMSDIVNNISPQVWSLIEWDGKRLKANSFSGKYSWGQVVI